MVIFRWLFSVVIVVHSLVSYLSITVNALGPIDRAKREVITHLVFRATVSIVVYSEGVRTFCHVIPLRHVSRDSPGSADRLRLLPLYPFHPFVRQYLTLQRQNARCLHAIQLDSVLADWLSPGFSGWARTVQSGYRDQSFKSRVVGDATDDVNVSLRTWSDGTSF